MLLQMVHRDGLIQEEGRILILILCLILVISFSVILISFLLGLIPCLAITLRRSIFLPYFLQFYFNLSVCFDLEESLVMDFGVLFHLSCRQICGLHQ